MGLINCGEIEECKDTCTIYDLCRVTVKATDSNGKCLPGEETQIICEGFKFSSKLDVEVKTNSACYEGYGYQVSNMQYDWEITNPCDQDWFDRRFVKQICDKYSMEITGYVQENCGGWVAKETLKACIIEETGRDYGKGVTRSLKGKALHRILHDGKTDDHGYTANASNAYKIGMQTALYTIGDRTIGPGGMNALNTALNLDLDDEYEWLKQGFIQTMDGAQHLTNDVKHLTNDITSTGKWAYNSLINAIQ